MKKLAWFVVIGIVFVCNGALAQSTTTTTQCAIQDAKVVEVVYYPEKRSAIVVLYHPQGGKVTGVGLAPADRFPTQLEARLAATRAAKDEAYVQLAERLCGVSVKK